MKGVQRKAVIAALTGAILAGGWWACRAEAATPDDAFLRGYAAAILQREFRVTGASLKVANGIITISGEELAGLNRQQVVTALSQIPGAVRVEVVEAGTSVRSAAAERPVPSPPDPRAGSPTSPSFPLPVGWLPEGHLFAPLLADPRWPHFSVAYHRYLGDRQFQDVGSVTFGETIPLYRWDGPAGGQIELGIQGGVFAIFNLDAESKDLINADYTGAVMGTYRLGDFSVLGRIFHQSAHLGDEFLLRSRVPRVNLSYETFDVKLSYDILQMVRVYGGGGVLFNRQPSNLKPLWTQGGIEFRSPWPGPDHALQPVAALDVKNFQENSWHADFSLRGGIQFNNIHVLGRSFQILVHYFNGNSPNGQFYRQRIKYIGIGGHFHF